MLKPQAITTRPQGHVRSWLDFRRFLGWSLDPRQRSPTPSPPPPTPHQLEKTLLDSWVPDRSCRWRKFKSYFMQRFQTQEMANVIRQQTFLPLGPFGLRQWKELSRNALPGGLNRGFTVAKPRVLTTSQGRSVGSFSQQRLVIEPNPFIIQSKLCMRFSECYKSQKWHFFVDEFLSLFVFCFSNEITHIYTRFRSEDFPAILTETHVTSYESYVILPSKND